MTTTELDDVMALLERLLPDPAAFAERLFQQAVTQWAGATDSRGSHADAPDTADRVDPRTVVIEPSYEPGTYETLADHNTLLASALGACDCWGSRADCALCKGEGSSGWTQPDVELFQVYVGPAVQKLSADAESDDDNRTEVVEDDNDNRPRQGVSA